MPTDVDAGATVSFILIGDQGTQDATQRATAQAIKTVCDERGCDFAIALGDNIYDVGPVAGPYDPQFTTAFEEPYAALDFPWYLTLGNHDDGGTGDVVLFGDYEVAYSQRTDTSGKWRMPSRYYNQTFNDGLLELWSIDGDTLTTYGRLEPDDIRLGPDVLYDGAAQRAWLHDSVRGSDATWKVVFGHYEYSSNGNYGDGDSDFKAVFEETLCDHAQFYFHGHEHDLRWLAPQTDCGRTEFIVSGAGARAETRTPDDQGNPEYFNYRETPGFFWIDFNGTTMTAIAYGTDDAVDGTHPVEVFRRVVTLGALGW